MVSAPCPSSAPFEQQMAAPVHSKGRGRGFGGRVRVRDRGGEDDAPPPPLDEDRVEQIRTMVREAGGSIILGKICHDHPGVKKVQLEGHFTFTRAGDQWQISLLEDKVEAVATVIECGATDYGAERLDGDRAAVLADVSLSPSPDAEVEEVAGEADAQVAQPEGGAPEAAEVDSLDPAQVEAIATFLESKGGALPLGRVTQQFSGLKRAQLETYFEFNRVGDHGQWEVRLPGVVPSGAEIMFDGQALSVDAPLPPLADEQVAILKAALELAPAKQLPLSQMLKLMPGIKRKQIEECFQVIRLDKKRFMVALDGKPGLSDQRRPGRLQITGAPGVPLLPTPKGAPRALRVPKVSLRTVPLLPRPPLTRWLLPGGRPLPMGPILGGGTLPHRPNFPAAGLARPAVRLWQGASRPTARGRAPLLPLPIIPPAALPATARRAPERREEFPPLEPRVLQEVEQLLRESGGSLPMGRVSSAFRFVKRQQLEGRFDLDRVKDQWVVRLRPKGVGRRGRTGQQEMIRDTTLAPPRRPHPRMRQDEGSRRRCRRKGTATATAG